MSVYYLLYKAIPICLLIVLFIIPLGYSCYRGEFKKSIRFTWIIWGFVWFIWELLLPAWAKITEMATGEIPDIMIAVPLLFAGVLIGWLSGLVLGFVGSLVHRIASKAR